MYYVVGIASVVLGWYFNIHLRAAVRARIRPTRSGANTAASRIHAAEFTNPAADSASQDYTIANVVLLPVFTIVDGYRRGFRRPWLFFVSSLFTSFTFAFAFYFATMERQRRHEKSRQSVNA